MKTAAWVGPEQVVLQDSPHRCSLLFEHSQGLFGALSWPERLPLPDYFLVAHVWLQRLWNPDRTVRLLGVLEDGQPGAADRQADAVERVDQFALFLRLRLVANICPGRLVGFEVGAGRDLAV